MSSHGQIVVGCDCFNCANSNPKGSISFVATDCSTKFLLPKGTQYQVVSSDGVDYGRIFRHELLEMRAQYGCQITFVE